MFSLARHIHLWSISFSDVVVVYIWKNFTNSEALSKRIKAQSCFIWSSDLGFSFALLTPKRISFYVVVNVVSCKVRQVLRYVQMNFRKMINSELIRWSVGHCVVYKYYCSSNCCYISISLWNKISLIFSW